MFCGKCGKEIKEGNSFCTGCGEQAVIEINESANFNTENEDSLLEQLIQETDKLLLSLGNIIDKSFPPKDNNSSIEGMKFGLFNFCLYLCELDNKVSYEEAWILNHLFNYNTNATKYTEVIVELIDNESFRSDVPVYLSVLQAIGTNNNTDRLCIGLIEVYKTYGKLFLDLNSASDNKIRDYTAYISMLEQYNKSENKT